MQKIETEHGIFTENTTTGQTAEEVYAEWLVNKDKPPQPTAEERLKMAEETILFLLTKHSKIGLVQHC